MKRTSTHYYFIFSGNDDPVLRKDQTRQRLSPKRQTMDFLMQFARTYYAETKLPKEMSGIVLN